MLDAGDMLQGNAFAAYQARQGRRQPNPIVEADEPGRLRCRDPGNHDFDWGVPELERALADAAFPYVSANLFRCRRTASWSAHSGCCGGADPRGRHRIHHARRDGVGRGPSSREDPRRADRGGRGRTFADMRRSSDLVVALAHSGVAGPSSYDTTGVGAEDVAGSFATMKARPDVVIVGHCTMRFATPRLARCGTSSRSRMRHRWAVVHVDMVRPRGREWQVGRIRSKLVSPAEVTPSAVVEQRLRPAHDAVRAWVGEAIGMGSRRCPPRRAAR